MSHDASPSLGGGAAQRPASAPDDACGWWSDDAPALGEVEAHSRATDAATGSTWGVWIVEPVNTLGARPSVVLLRAMADGSGVWAHVDGERAVALPDALARLGEVRWMRWLFGPAQRKVER